MQHRWRAWYLFPDDRLPGSIAQHWETRTTQPSVSLFSSAHTVFIATQPLSELCTVVSDRRRLFTQPWKENKTRTHGKVRTQTVPVVFFLLTVLSALCRFCKGNGYKDGINYENVDTVSPPPGWRCATHIVLDDLFDTSHCQDEDERDQRGVATGRWYIGDLLTRVKERQHSEILANSACWASLVTRP